jgi:hypothetical protein
MDSGIPSPYQLQEIAHAKLIGAIMNAGKK